MIIKKISDAENFVSSHKNFHWDGWDIVHTIEDDYAEYLACGSFDRETGKWYRKTVFKYDDSGWNIPDAAI